MKKMNDFEKFKNTYLAILFESSFHEFEKGNPIPYIKKPLYFPKRRYEFIKALKNAKWIYDNENIKFLYTENIITEAPGSIDYPGTLCDKIISLKNSKVLTNKEVLSYINEDWKYYNELKEKGHSIKIFKFNFSNKEEMNKNFNIPNLDENTKEMYVNEFLKNKNSKGSYFKFLNFSIFAFNINYTKKTILHEFTHYLQDILNVEKIKVKENLDKNKLKFLNLSDENLSVILEILKNGDEIIPYINEFCENVMNVFKEYQKLDKNLKWEDNSFIKYFIDVLLNSNNIKNEKFFNIYKKINDEDILPLYVVIGCFIYEIDLEKIKRIMYEENKYL